VSWTTIRHSGVPENTHSAAWRIGEKPHDPLDPGPYGTPGWQPDPRRGRRRRGELPDPPPVERRESMPVERRNESNPTERRGEPHPEERRRIEHPGRSWFGSPDRSEPLRARPEPAEPQDFSPMREAAYRAFLRDSEQLHRAHLEAPEPNRILVYLRWYLRIVVAILYWRVVPFPEPPSRCRRSRAVCGPRQAHQPRQAARYVGRAAVPTRPVVDSIGAAPFAADPIEAAQLATAPTEPLPTAAHPTERMPIPTQSARPPQIGAQPVEPPPVAAQAVSPAAAPPIAIEWRTVARPQVRPTATAARAAEAGAIEATVSTTSARAAMPTPARRVDLPRSRPPVRPQSHRLAVMTPRNGTHSRRRADTRRIFLHTYAITRDQNLRDLTWPKGSWEGFTASDPYANPRRGSIQRRRNHRPRNLALARSFPSTTPVVPVGATSRPAPIGPTTRLVPATATPFPGGDLR
jgi:hypothetical protein